MHIVLRFVARRPGRRGPDGRAGRVPVSGVAAKVQGWAHGPCFGAKQVWCQFWSDAEADFKLISLKMLEIAVYTKILKSQSAPPPDH